MKGASVAATLAAGEKCARCWMVLEEVKTHPQTHLCNRCTEAVAATLKAGRQALILPCLARSDKDIQSGGLQMTTVEDGMSMVHMSTGMRRPGFPPRPPSPAPIASVRWAKASVGRLLNAL